MLDIMTCYYNDMLDIMTCLACHVNIIIHVSIMTC